MGLEMPRFIEENWDYIDENEKLCIKENAPDWAKKEYEEFMKKINKVPDENGIVTEY